MKRVLKYISAIVIAVAAFLWQPAGTEMLTYRVCAAEAAVSPATPKASLASGTYTVSRQKTVKLSCSSKKAKIYYSINGGKYRVYTKPISISKKTTLKFYSKLNGVKSKVVTRKYNLKPVFSAETSGSCPLTVELSTPVSGAEIYYTTDGTKPTKSSEKYTEPITVTRSCAIRAAAIKSGWTTAYITKKAEFSPVYQPSYLNDYTAKYYYNQLDKTGREAYERIYNAAESFESYVWLTDLSLTYDEVYNISQMVGFENPQLFWLDGRSHEVDGYWQGDEVLISGFYLEYLRTPEEAAEIAPRLEKKAREIVSRAQEEGSVFFCVKYLHDYILDNAEYDYYASSLEDGSLGNHADELLLGGKAVCAGYSRGMSYLLQSAGIPEVGIVGDTSGGQHMWNKVKIGDGWYNIDSTWDDSDDRYLWFCLTDKAFTDHTPRSALPLSAAAAVSTEYSYVNAMGITVYHTVDEAVTQSMKLLAQGYNKGKREFVFYYEKGLAQSVYDRLVDEFFTLVNANGAYPTFEEWAFFEDHFYIRVS